MGLVAGFFTVAIMILSRYRYRDAFLGAFFELLIKIPSSNGYFYLRALAKFLIND
jgi:hypothetical protein